MNENNHANVNEQNPPQTEEPIQTVGEVEDVSLDFNQLDEQAADSPLTLLEDENGRLKDQLLRMAAEMENLRRRAAEDVSKAHKFAIDKFADALMPVQDSLEKPYKITVATST